MTLPRAELRRARKRRPRRRVALWILIGGLVVVIVAAVAWVGVRALMAKSELSASASLAATIQQEIVSGDAKAAKSTFVELSQRASKARELTSDPVWRVAEFTPLVGTNLAAARQLAGVVANVTDRAIGPLTGLAATIKLADFKPIGGAVTLQPLINARPAVAAADAELTRALTQVRAIDITGTGSQVNAAVGQLEGVLGKVSGAVNSMDRALQVVPALLGADGPRNYLVLFQNNAELRAGGGNPGAIALLHTDHGKISLISQGSSADFPYYPKPVLDIPIETRGLYGNIVGQYIQDVTLTPKFPLAAQLAQEMWRRQYGMTVDGVLALDPVTLGYILTATGPIALPSGDTLTSQNAVKLLLSDSYARYTRPSDQDAFFASAASAVFARVADGNLDPKALIAALTRAGDEHRIQLWESNPALQAVLDGTTLAGGLPLSTKTTKRFGVYFNDATGAKMDYYLSSKVDLGQAVCRKDGRPTFRVSVTLKSLAPVDAASTLRPYVTGGGIFGVTPGNVRTNVAVYGPSGSLFAGATMNGVKLPLQSTTDSGHPVGQFPIELAPGQSITVQLDFLGDAPFNGQLVAQQTPVIYQIARTKLAFSCDFPLG
ncbi:MAG: hypothetical protein QOD05_1646 [Microbacteriaceae bacterium]|jgi:hypothetical protein|nr:hypothetical protein [Microbacteriaceae bacterium]